MNSNSFSDGLVIRELSQKELNNLLDVHFRTLFSNRQEHKNNWTVTEEAEKKIRERSQQENKYHLKLGVFLNEEFVGWHYGWSTDANTYYMANSAVLEKFRGQGIYTYLLECVLTICQKEGFQVITSTHHANNSSILIPKLKSGFMISGIQFHERFKFLVELRYFFDSDRRRQIGKNMGLDLESLKDHKFLKNKE